MVILKKKPNAIILAGGKSTRFGSDKAFYIPSNETKTWVELLVAKLIPVSSLIYISIRHEQLQKMHTLFSENKQVCLVTDLNEVADYGPLGGLYSLSRHLNDESCLIVPVDVPHIQTADLKRLCRNNNVYVETAKHKHYLIAHLPSFQTEISSCIQHHEHRVTSLLEKLHTTPLFFENEDAFTNQNTKIPPNE
jgi:molybdopterin-guanine dinucleotide biosynthesis protein A